jgi:hypothetical protein
MPDKKPKYQTLPGVIIDAKRKYKTLPGITVNAKTKKKASSTTDWKMTPPINVSESTSPASTRLKQNIELENGVKQYKRMTRDGLKEISKEDVKNVPEPIDTRPWDSEGRARERAAAADEVLKKSSAIGQFVPYPLIKYPSMAVNAAYGIGDAYSNYNEGDNLNAAINTAGAFPFGLFGKYGTAAEVAGAAAEFTDNFGLEQKKNGGTSNKTITCTCGHSWNTSDSSKKDATVCHICGKDNVMKMQNGGWLNKYQPSPEYDTLPEVVVHAKTKGRKNANANWSWDSPVVMTPTTDMVGMGVPNFKQFIETSEKIKAQQARDLKESMYASGRKAAQATVSPSRTPTFGPEADKQEGFRREQNRAIAASDPSRYKYNYDTGDLVIKENASPSEWSNASFIHTPEFVQTVAQLTPSGRDYGAGEAGANFFVNAFPYIAPITATGRLTSQLSGLNDEYGINNTDGLTWNNVFGGTMMGLDAVGSVAGVGPGIKAITNIAGDAAETAYGQAKNTLAGLKQEFAPPSYPFGRNVNQGENWTQYIAVPEIQNRLNLTQIDAYKWLDDLMIRKTGKDITTIINQTSTNPNEGLKYQRIIHDELFGNTGGGRYDAINTKIDAIAGKFKSWGDYLSKTKLITVKDVFNKLDLAAGKAVGFNPGSIESITKEANRLLSQGLGIKKTSVDVSLDLKTYPGGNYRLNVKVNDPNLGWVELGYIDLESNTTFAPATLSNKIKKMLGKPMVSATRPNVEKGFIKELDYPTSYQNQLNNQGIAYDYRNAAIGSEAHQAIKQGAEKYNTNLLSSKSHVSGTRTSGTQDPAGPPSGEVRYLREYLNGRLQGVSNESLNPGWEQRVKDYMQKSGKTNWTTHEVELLLDSDPTLAPKQVRFKYEDGGNIEASQGGYTNIPFNYNSAWGGQFQMGGSLPGSVGFTYARTKGIPSEGPYAKKTMPSAQNGKKLSYNKWMDKYNLEETPDYNLKRAWELGYVPDETGHLPTVDNETGQFLKAKGHPTIQKELDWYNSPEGAEFRSKNSIDSSGNFFKYIPKGQNGQEMRYYQHGLDWKPKGMKNGGKSSDTNYKFSKSKIEGVGTFAKNTIQPGDYIGKVHTINELGRDYDFTSLGNNHNHSDNPNVQNVLIGNERHLVAIKPIAKGQELTSNYRLQPDLEQPEDFEKKNNKKKNGGWLNQYK